MFKSKFFLAVAIVTLVILIATIALQVWEMKTFKMF